MARDHPQKLSLRRSLVEEIRKEAKNGEGQGSDEQDLYSVHPGVAMVEKWIAEMKVKTGMSLEGWIALARKEGPKEDKARRAWLKTKHNLGTNSAWWISERVDGKALRKVAQRRS